MSYNTAETYGSHNGHERTGLFEERKEPALTQRLLASLLFCLVLLSLVGCNATKTEPSMVPPITPAQTFSEPEQRYANPGSLYADVDSDSLFADTRARRIGDIVMVRIIESMKARNKADTTTNKENTNNYGVSAYVSPFSINPLGTDRFNSKGGPGAVFDTSSKSDFKADGETKRENVVTATVAARVVRLMPGGAMQIEGARETQVNGETQYLVVRGIIRGQDVMPDNSIDSTRIADSHIAYYGQGIITDKQKPGWLSRLLDNLFPF